jgi:hypothetical protein
MLLNSLLNSSKFIIYEPVEDIDSIKNAKHIEFIEIDLKPISEIFPDPVQEYKINKIIRNISNSKYNFMNSSHTRKSIENTVYHKISFNSIEDLDLAADVQNLRPNIFKQCFSKVYNFIANPFFWRSAEPTI